MWVYCSACGRDSGNICAIETDSEDTVNLLNRKNKGEFQLGRCPNCGSSPIGEQGGECGKCGTDTSG